MAATLEHLIEIKILIRGYIRVRLYAHVFINEFDFVERRGRGAGQVLAHDGKYTKHRKAFQGQYDSDASRLLN
jgi:hypothetical protein